MEDAKEIGTAQPQVDAEVKEEVKVEPKKDWGPVKSRVRNDNGDFIVTTINIPDIVVPQLVQESGSSDEEESSEEEPVEEVKEEAAEKKGKFASYNRSSSPC
jgi:hypothetical protein